MKEALEQCPQCQRHVRVSEASCPFCGQERTATPAVELRVEPLGISRAAIIALGASLTLSGCDTIRERLFGAPPVVNPYGAPIPRPGPDAATAMGNVYGGPPPQPVVDAAVPLPTPVYGAPVPPPETPQGQTRK